MRNDGKSEYEEDETVDKEREDLKGPKKKKEKNRNLRPKIPQLELRVFDHSFPYGLSLPSHVIEQVSIIHQLVNFFSFRCKYIP